MEVDVAVVSERSGGEAYTYQADSSAGPLAAVGSSEPASPYCASGDVLEEPPQVQEDGGGTVSEACSALDDLVLESVPQEPRDAGHALSEANAAPTSNDPVESIDRLTAMEMLQLLKEYKKREFLYVSQITTLQHELHSQQNVSLAPSFFNSACVPAPFELSPAVYHDISAVGHNALLDPTVNLEIRELRLKLFEQANELQKTKDELRASSFSADSVMGRRLINKCKALQEENTDIGKMLLETNLQPLQIQIGILQKQLAFFKQQLKVFHASTMELEDDNVKLTRQLQDLTLHLKGVEQERDLLLKKLVTQEQAAEAQAKAYRQQKEQQVQESSRSNASDRAEHRRRSHSRTHQGTTSSLRHKRSVEDTPKSDIQENSSQFHRHSESGSQTRHRHRKVIESTGTVVPTESRGIERKPSPGLRDGRRLPTSSSNKQQATRRDERSRRGSRRGGGSREPSGEHGRRRSGSERGGGRSPGGPRY